MSLVNRGEGADARFELGGDVTIAEAAELHGALILALVASPNMSLDLSGVEAIDIAGVQVLAALVREFPGVQLCNPSETLQKTVDFLKMTCLQEAFVFSAAGGES